MATLGPQICLSLVISGLPEAALPGASQGSWSRAQGSPRAQGVAKSLLSQQTPIFRLHHELTIRTPPIPLNPCPSIKVTLQLLSSLLPLLPPECPLQTPLPPSLPPGFLLSAAQPFIRLAQPANHTVGLLFGVPASDTFLHLACIL